MAAPATPGPPADGPARLLPTKIRIPSMTPGLVPRPSGFRLDRFEALQADWPDEDRAAFARFLDERAAPAFERHLEKARAVQAVVREQVDEPTQALRP